MLGIDDRLELQEIPEPLDPVEVDAHVLEEEQMAFLAHLARSPQRPVEEGP
jgi:hypothetical protein